jgi:hypothetical protein
MRYYFYNLGGKKSEVEQVSACGCLWEQYGEILA